MTSNKRNLSAAKTRRTNSNADTQALARIDLLTRNAKNLWFGMLGTLVFASITLFGIEDIDFFGVDRSTQLPLINVSVPVAYFFGAGATFCAAIYIYFHLYLLQLWEELGRICPRPNGRSLNKAIYPWLVTDTMVRLRGRLRGDDCADPRSLTIISRPSTTLLVWYFGPAVLGYFWWRSIPAHNWGMTLYLNVLVLLVFYTMSKSMTISNYALSYKENFRLGIFSWFMIRTMIMSAMATSTIQISWYWIGTSSNARGLFQAKLNGAELTILPTDWRPYPHARKWFFSDWCSREDLGSTCQGITAIQINERQGEWHSHRRNYLETLSRPNLSGRDLRGANLINSFMPYIDFFGTRFEGANLGGAKMESADLRSSMMQKADLRWAQLWAADLSTAQLQDAIIINTSLAGSNLDATQLQRANMSWANLEGALLAGSAQNPMLLKSTNFTATVTKLVAVKHVVFTDANIQPEQISQMFGDASVVLPDSMENRPCHWATNDLKTSFNLWVAISNPNDPFIGRWRGWVEANGGAWPTSRQFYGFKDVIAIPPPPECPLIKDM